MQSFVLLCLISGLVGTTAMLATLYFLAYVRAVEIRLPLALGAILLNRMEGALPVGLVFHYVFGITWGFIYSNIIFLTDSESSLSVVFMALGISVLHGALATLVMIGASARHPLPKFRESPVVSSVAHGAAHLAFGLGVGVTLIALR